MIAIILPISDPVKHSTTTDLSKYFIIPINRVVSNYANSTNLGIILFPSFYSTTKAWFKLQIYLDAYNNRRFNDHSLGNMVLRNAR